MNYNNPYYNYNNYNYNQQSPMQMQVPQMQMPMQTNYVMFAFVDGFDGARNYILNPGQMIILKDTKNDVIYEKTSDNQGRYNLKVYNVNSNANQTDEKGDIKTLSEKFDKLYEEIQKRFVKEEKVNEQ